MRKRTNLSKYLERKHKEHKERIMIWIESMIGWECRQSKQNQSKKNQTQMEYRIACLRQAMVSLNDYTKAREYYSEAQILMNAKNRT